MSRWTCITRYLLLSSTLLFAVSNRFCLQSATAADLLTIGSDAPPINVEHWVQDGGGKFKPVTKFENGKVYVIEFWATWCGPCIGSMPHLAQIQKDFADKGVQIVSISNEPLETVETFLERSIPDQILSGIKGSDEDKDELLTFKDLTSAYCLTTDPDKSSDKSYMTAAGQNGIPCAFIVGKDQKIEWIGHPMSMDEPLTAVVEGNWDRDAFLAEFKKQQEDEAKMSAVFASMQSGDSKGALNKIDDIIEESSDPALLAQMKMMKLRVLMNADDMLEDFVAALPEAYKDNAKNPMLINMLAWTVYEKFEAGKLENKDIIKQSRIAAEKAAETADSSVKGAILDTAAHLQFIDGDTQAALATQEKAVELATGDMKEQLMEFLNELKKAAKKSDK